MPLSTYPYTAWPTPEDVLDRLQSAGVTLRAEDPSRRISQVAVAIEQEVTHNTRRQFVPDAEDTSRRYDGSGNSELEVDEMIELSKITIIGFEAEPLYDLSDVLLIEQHGKPKTRLVTARGSFPAWTAQAVLLPQYFLFPAGRQNILVTGRFGYGESIPPDLWEAVCGEIALRATNEALFRPEGRLAEEQYGDERRKYALTGAEATGWHDAFLKVLKDYKRPSGAALRKRHRTMI